MNQWLAVAVSLAAFVVAAMSYVKSSVAVRAQVFLEFRKRFSELKGSIPAWYSASTIPDGASAAELRAVALLAERIRRMVRHDQARTMAL